MRRKGKIGVEWQTLLHTEPLVGVGREGAWGQLVALDSPCG